MIVTLTNEGYDIIFQPAHGLLAAKLASHWAFKHPPAYHMELLTAIAQHDNNQRTFSKNNSLTQAGAPRGFTVSSDEQSISDLSQPEQTIKDAYYQGRYIALMVSMHATHLYGNTPDPNTNLQTFLKQQQQQQKQWRKDLGVTKKQAQHDYQLMLWCDRASLILCQSHIPQAERKLEVQRTPDGKRSYLWQTNNHLTVDPWPFKPTTFTVTTEVHHLTQLEFASDEALLEALLGARVSYREWVFVRG